MATNTAQTYPSARHIAQPNIVFLRKNIVFSQGNATVVTLGAIPAGALILKAMSGVQVITAFNAGTTNTVDIGTAASGAVLASGASTATVAFVALSAATGVYRVAADTVLTATINLSGTTATTGDAEIVIAYVESI
jgi:hypothetical protein